MLPPPVRCGFTSGHFLFSKRDTLGFNDSRAHFLDGGMRVAGVRMRDARIPEIFRGRIRGLAAKLPKGRWILLSFD